METDLYAPISVNEQGNQPISGDNRDKVYKGLLEHIKTEIRKLGLAVETFTEHMLEAIKRACAIDGRLVDDPCASPFDLGDMMVLSEDEMGEEDEINGKRQKKSRVSKISHHQSHQRNKETLVDHYWCTLVEHSRKPEETHYVTPA